MTAKATETVTRIDMPAKAGAHLKESVRQMHAAQTLVNELEAMARTLLDVPQGWAIGEDANGIYFAPVQAPQKPEAAAA